MTVKWLTDGWISYVHRILPRGSTQIQVQETRRAFYAGMQHYHGVLATLDADATPAERTRILAEIERELQTFVKFVGSTEEQLANAFETDFCGIAITGGNDGKH